MKAEMKSITEQKVVITMTRSEADSLCKILEYYTRSKGKKSRQTPKMIEIMDELYEHIFEVLEEEYEEEYD